ncbi:MAG: hypothetical protein HYS13_18665 [Planctomycetia bacterium]|nr:hypothetical protein [Planctomycetia bacterium]
MLQKMKAMFGQFCVATILAQAVLAGYLVGTGALDRMKLAQIVAVVHGIDVLRARAAAAEGPKETVTVEDIVEARAAKLQQMATRDLALDRRQALLDAQQSKLMTDMESYQTAKLAFQKYVDDWETGQKRQALDDAVALVGGMKPKQAKDQVVLMLQKEEMDFVVRIMESLPVTQRSKLMAEFKTPEENQQLADILRSMREAKEKTAPAEQARAAVGAAAPM